MKKITIGFAVCALAFAVTAYAHEAGAQIDLSADAKASAKVNISTGVVKVNGAASTTVTGNATSSAASDKSDRSDKANGNSTSSASTEVKGNATSSAAKDKGTSVAAEHKSEVAVFVQTLVNSADRLWGIGEQVRVVARDQASSSAKISASIEKIEARGGFKDFLVGTDYKTIGEIRSELAQTSNRLSQLERELQKVGSTTDAITVAAEIDALTNTQADIEAFLKAKENKFSLFGWVKKLSQ
jgi:hypothetical protein